MVCIKTIFGGGGAMIDDNLSNLKLTTGYEILIK